MFLINHHSISHNGIGTNRIASLLYRIPGVSFYGIDGCSVTAFHDSHMVARSIMLPVKKDDRTGTWHTTCPLPSSLVLKPVLPVRTNRKFWHRTALNESCLVCTPGHETAARILTEIRNRLQYLTDVVNKSCLIRTPADKSGTPFFPTVKSIP